jgi:hypothetical protein
MLSIVPPAAGPITSTMLSGDPVALSSFMMYVGTPAYTSEMALLMDAGDVPARMRRVA